MSCCTNVPKDFMVMPSSHSKYLKYSVYHQRARKQGKRLSKFGGKEVWSLHSSGRPSCRSSGKPLQMSLENVAHDNFAESMLCLILTPCSALKCLCNGPLMASLSIADVFNFIIFIVLKLSITWDPKPEI